MALSSDTYPVALGVIGILMGAMVGPIAGDLWRKIKGTEYATKAACKDKHDAMDKDCKACNAKTTASICSIQHEAAKSKKLMILIAMKVGVDKDDLKDFL